MTARIEALGCDSASVADRRAGARPRERGPSRTIERVRLGLGLEAEAGVAQQPHDVLARPRASPPTTAASAGDHAGSAWAAVAVLLMGQ